MATEVFKGPFSRKIEKGLKFIDDQQLAFSYIIDVINHLAGFMEKGLQGQHLEVYKERVFPYLTRAVNDLGQNDYDSAMRCLGLVEGFANETIPEKLNGIGDGFLYFYFVPLEKFPRELEEYTKSLIGVEGPDGSRFVLYDCIINASLEGHEDNLGRHYMNGIPERD
jgi:hypothetical protein